MPPFHALVERMKDDQGKKMLATPNICRTPSPASLTRTAPTTMIGIDIGKAILKQ
jgi:hypothetical protein